MHGFERWRREKRLGARCLHCGSTGRLTLHAVEERWWGLRQIPVQRVRCGHCGRTFRLLPAFVIPYGRYRLEDVEAGILAYEARGSYHGAGRQVGRDERLVKRWVQWWRRHSRATGEAGLLSWLVRPGVLRALLEEFPCWRRGRPSRR